MNSWILLDRRVDLQVEEPLAQSGKGAASIAYDAIVDPWRASGRLRAAGERRIAQPLRAPKPHSRVDRGDLREGLRESGYRVLVYSSSSATSSSKVPNHPLSIPKWVESRKFNPQTHPHRARTPE
jgi:hypothetical protein